MKKSEIGKGRFYTDGKLGVREVLDEGPQFKLYEGVEDDDCLRYRTLNAKSSTDTGESSCTRVAFAAWAKTELDASEVETHLTQLQATKLAKKLTAPQRAFLEGFDQVNSVTTAVECQRSEYRVAISCQKHGIIDQLPNHLRTADCTFEVTFTPLGIAVLEKVQGCATGAT